LMMSLGFAGAHSVAHETDQYSVPCGREFADLRLYFSQDIYNKLVDAVNTVNDRIEGSLRDGRATPRTHLLQQPDAIATAVHSEFPLVINHVELLELELRSPGVKDRFPGLIITHLPLLWIYHHWALCLDPTKLVRLSRTSTIMINGTYLGTDKFVHFVHMGYIYYSTYRRAIREGVDAREAMRRAVALGTGPHPFLSEGTLLGMFTTAVWSNADLAANYVGLKFFINLTESVSVRGEQQPPLMVRDGMYWRLNDHVHPDSEFFAVFVTDHWDEALNPNCYAPGMGGLVAVGLKQRCSRILQWYTGCDGATRSKEEFRAIAQRLSSYYGEDYGHKGNLDEMVGIATYCFDVTEHELADERVEELVEMTAGAGDVPLSLGGNPSELPVDKRTETGDRAGSIDRLGRTSLWWAATRGDAAQVERLISAGADADWADFDGERALHSAARWGHVDVVEMLLKRGAEYDAKAIYGYTPLHISVREGRDKVTRVLLEAGADANARDDFGCTPLHDAAARGRVGIAELLLAAGAEPNAPDYYGTTPRHRATRSAHTELAQLLQSAGADLDVLNRFGGTARDEGR